MMDRAIVTYVGGTIVRAIIFDMDGTLFETNPVALQGFKETFQRLKDEGLYEGDIPADEILLDQLGKTFEDIWAQLLPDSTEEVKHRADELMLEIELDLIRQGVGQLYPNVEQVLRKLQAEGYSLFIASNGREEYISAIVNHFQLEDVFVDLYSAGRFHTSTKVDLVRKLIRSYEVTSGYMVGDRRSDIEAGKENGLTTIGCQFGFADQQELKDADHVITSFSQLISIIS